MGKKVDKVFWFTASGLALIGGWRRQGDGVEEIAAKMEIGTATLKRWANEHEEIDAALRIDREVADFMVEDVLFSRSLAGYHKAYEFWLKHRMPQKWGKAAAEGEEAGKAADYTGLAQLINNPVEREGCDFE
ncbi:MAG: hypothetical protein LBE55_03345 [Clostridiales bacterium]|nr:hypothetical protein [Clostridiales bacterium]